MPMVNSGPISLGGNATSGGLNQSVNIELGRAATASINMNESAVRTLAGVPSGAISMNNFYGKSNEFAFTISTNQTNANLRTLAVNAGWNQSSRVAATINNGVVVSSNDTGTPGLTVNGSFPGGVTLTNNGTIAGMGGKGGNGWNISGQSSSGGQAGFAGGTALAVSVALTLANNGTIAGGGGGGGTGASRFFGSTSENFGAGGGGGGRSGSTNSAAGSGGSASGAEESRSGSAGGAGTFNSAGGGGTGGSISPFFAGNGGAGGGWGAGGSSGTSGSGASQSAAAQGGGAAGSAITGNSNITYTATGTRLGPIS